MREERERAAGEPVAAARPDARAPSSWSARGHAIPVPAMSSVRYRARVAAGAPALGLRSFGSAGALPRSLTSPLPPVVSLPSLLRSDCSSPSGARHIVFFVPKTA